MKNIDDYIKYLNNRTLRVKRKIGSDVFVSVYFEHQGNQTLLLDQVNRENISLLRQLVDSNPYDKIQTIIHEDESDFNVYYDKQSILTDADIEKKKILQELSASSNSTMMPAMPTMPNQSNFNGFGQAQVEDMISKRLEEEKTRMELIDLRDKVQKKDQKISNLNQSIEELQGKLEEAAQEQERLEGVIKLKEDIRYYAGFAGDILESIGLDKSKLRQPLAGLLQEESQKQIESSKEDESGIVEEESTNPNDTVISMINEFLKRTDKETLALIYEILVFIEKDKNTALYLYNHLTQQEKAE
jgi:hypothetical protein